MVLVISQETFDDAVKENINELEMSPEEAIEDAVKQFQAQGVDLSNIIKDLMISKAGDTHIVSAALSELGHLAKEKSPPKPEDVQAKLLIIKNECDRGLEYRVFAGKEGAYNVIMDVMLRHEENIDVTKDCLKTLTALMTKQPDLLTKEGINTMIAYLDKQKDPEVLRQLLKWIKECCVMHEMNRQHIFQAAILDHLKPLLEEATPTMVRDVLAVLRALVLDDDVRVEFGRSHEHARAIASDVLCNITSFLSKYKTDEALMSDLMLTLSSLLVRNEFCKKVEDAGGLDTIKDGMITFYEKEKIIKQCFKLIKALAGNDEVKVHFIQKEFVPILISSLDRHKNSVATAAAGLGCLATITLRSPDNSKVIFEAGAAEVIVECMKCHPNDITVQKNGSWAIRNMVSRSRYQNEKFLSLGVEDVLVQDLKKFPQSEYDFKSALRDLGCNVQLREEWTGKGGMLTSQAKKD